MKLGRKGCIAVLVLSLVFTQLTPAQSFGSQRYYTQSGNGISTKYRSNRGGRVSKWLRIIVAVATLACEFTGCNREASGYEQNAPPEYTPMNYETVPTGGTAQYYSPPTAPARYYSPPPALPGPTAYSYNAGYVPETRGPPRPSPTPAHKRAVRPLSTPGYTTMATQPVRTTRREYLPTASPTRPSAVYTGYSPTATSTYGSPPQDQPGPGIRARLEWVKNRLRRIGAFIRGIRFRRSGPWQWECEIRYEIPNRGSGYCLIRANGTIEGLP